MQRFSIEYITGNSAPTYGQETESTDAVIQMSNHDGLLTNYGSNYMHTSLHLEDVYSVISKDVGQMTSPLVNDVTHHVSSNQPSSSDSSYNSLDDRTSPLPSPPTVDCILVSDITPVTSPGDSKLSRDRNTPSPQKDSGIDSDNSPVPAVDVNKTLKALEKKAKNLKSEGEKPPQSYIALIAQAILDTRDRKCTLGEIYRHITEHHAFYDNDKTAWRNSIRYNLSINECFIKAGKDETCGKGNFWAIHPSCVDDFMKGDYRRRQARRRAKRGAMKEVKLTYSAVKAEATYQAMTPSYVSYHPYAAPGYANQQQYQPTSSDSSSIYSGHTLPHAAYYNTGSHYAAPVSQYSAMPTSGYIPNMYSYAQPEQSYLQSAYGYKEYKPESENTIAHQPEESEEKWYASPIENTENTNTIKIEF